MIRFDEWLPVSAEHLWSILGTVDRVDWVPGVTACELDGSVDDYICLALELLQKRLK